MQSREHWEQVYGERSPDEVSWYQPHVAMSLALIEATGLGAEAAVIDVGGGASTLVDDLLARGFSDLTVLDLSQTALDAARERLGEAGQVVHWLQRDITAENLDADRYDLWHDRAVFHFLTEAADRAAYRANLERALKPGGQLIMATFAEDGPEQCSGLPVCRYSPDALAAELGPAFELLEHRRELHHTPGGKEQAFKYCRFRRLEYFEV